MLRVRAKNVRKPNSGTRSKAKCEVLQSLARRQVRTRTSAHKRKFMHGGQPLPYSPATPLRFAILPNSAHPLPEVLGRYSLCKLKDTVKGLGSSAKFVGPFWFW